ncbi:kinase domain protein [Dictyocaulus viviparus]|uniref:non-specific serine/threonine protein kinase n=1 Tax=Dictyocaulus viviparus TaxID=29172 RepID=A0A0D8Y436_DICVI|nr:kinase domain protein [Dictyocaulus viviparus]
MSLPFFSIHLWRVVNVFFFGRKIKMPPSTIEMDKTPERNSFHSIDPSLKHLNNVFTQPRSLKVYRPCSRVYPHGFPVSRPRLVSKKGIPSDSIEKNSTIYKYEKERNYFEQCFREIRVLGRGLFGEALEVECKETGDRYAVKRALHTFESAGNRQLKLREATNHEAIPPHENIVRFEKAWEERGRLYIQTELCGANLAEYREKLGVLPDPELWKILHDMVKALHHMHSLGMLHMDIKPSNIFISGNSTCKLGDFGLAFDTNKISRDTAEEGDKYYMAPEILNNSPTTAADVYSLGVSMLELATTINVRDHCHDIRDGKLPKDLFTDSQNDDIRELILSLIRPDPQERPMTSQLINDARILANSYNFVAFRELEMEHKKKLQTGPLDKDWDFEFEGMVLLYQKTTTKFILHLYVFQDHDYRYEMFIVRIYRLQLKVSGEMCLRFEDSSDDESLSCNSEKSLRRKISMRRNVMEGVTVRKLNFSDSSNKEVLLKKSCNVQHSVFFFLIDNQSIMKVK